MTANVEWQCRPGLVSRPRAVVSDLAEHEHAGRSNLLQAVREDLPAVQLALALPIPRAAVDLLAFCRPSNDRETYVSFKGIYISRTLPASDAAFKSQTNLTGAAVCARLTNEHAVLTGIILGAPSRRHILRVHRRQEARRRAPLAPDHGIPTGRRRGRQRGGDRRLHNIPHKLI